MTDPDIRTESLEAIVERAIANHTARGEAFHAYKTFDPARMRREAVLADVARGGGEETALALALVCERALGQARDRIGTPPMCGA